MTSKAEGIETLNGHAGGDEFEDPNVAIRSEGRTRSLTMKSPEGCKLSPMCSRTRRRLQSSTGNHGQ
jgi:hypothetical protein